MTLCSTPESLDAVIQALSGQTHVFLDCEGRTLGEVGGKLSLLNLGVMRQNGRLQTFLIDVLAFEGARSHSLTPIFEVLRSEQVFKVVFDGRMDASELLHGHGVQLRNVLDLQVADIASREKRGQDDNRRLQRLIGFLPQQEITRNRSLYLQVEKLNSLESAMVEHGVPGSNKGYVDHSRWLQRPLQQSALQYAANDIHKICLLYSKLVQKGYITSATLVRQSARYLALHASARPGGNEKYKRHGLFPLAILLEANAGSLIRCGGCQRGLPASCFAQSGSINRANGFCFVCRAIDAKSGPGSVATSRHRTFYSRNLYDDFEDLDDNFDDFNDNFDDFNDNFNDNFEDFYDDFY